MPCYLQLLKNGCFVNEMFLDDGLEYSIGRGTDNNIVLPQDPSLSSKHLTFTFRSGNIIVKDISTNGVIYDIFDLPPNQDYKVDYDTPLILGNGIYEIMFSQASKKNYNPSSPSGSSSYSTPTSTYNDPNVINLDDDDIIILDEDDGYGTIFLDDTPPNEILNLDKWFRTKKTLLIGRGEDCDIRLPSLKISLKHLKITSDGKGYYLLEDFSSNGVFVNGKRVNKKCYVDQWDEIEIESYQLTLGGSLQDLRSSEYVIVAKNVSKKFKNKEWDKDKTKERYKVALQPLNISIPSKEFVALMGPSGCGKSTLLKVLNGFGLSDTGAVYLNGHQLNKANYNYVKRKIGYVPQDDIVHKELSVDDTMYYAAKLRLARDVSDLEIQRKITEILASLKMSDDKIRKTLVGDLSGGQRKRISIAVELLDDPDILFLDEPTSPLDPQVIGEFLEGIKRLTRTSKTTVIMVTHKPDDLKYVDKVAFLSVGGYLSYYGAKEDLLPYFSIDDITKVYSLLDDKEKGQYYNSFLEVENDTDHSDKKYDNKKADSFEQFYWLSKRYFHIKLNDKGNLMLLGLQPVGIALLLFGIHDRFQLGILFLTAISAIWFGVSNAAREIVGEKSIYERERMLNVRILPYLFSKIIVQSAISLAQVILFIGIVFVLFGTFKKVDGICMHSFFPNVGWMFYLTFSASLLGLMLSSMVKTTEMAATLMPLFLIPQIMLAGTVVRIDNRAKESLSYFMLSRWGMEGLCRIQDESSKALKLYDVENDSSLMSVYSIAPIMKDSVMTIPFHYDTTIVFEVPPIGEQTEIIVIDDSIIDTASVPSNRFGPKSIKAMGTDGIDYYFDEPKMGDLPAVKSFGLFNSLFKNFLAITILNLIVFFFLYLQMKKKDPI